MISLLARVRAPIAHSPLRRVAFQTKNAALYQAATTALSVDQQTVLMEVMSLAESQQHPTQ